MSLDDETVITSSMTEAVKSDIPKNHWIIGLAPAWARPYLRLARIDRPIGVWLLLLPGWWSLCLAAETWPDPWLLFLFAVGAVVMRGAGCTLNDIADRDFDAKVARTAGRPLPSGEVGLHGAYIFLVLQLSLGFLVLLQFNFFAILVGAASLGLVAVYPFMKRITYWPQAVLGLAFNWGALLGWAAERSEIGWPAVALYLAGIFWTLGYDTIYAHQDREDDLTIGVKSTALRLGRGTRPWLAGFYGLTISLIGLAGWLAGLGWTFFAVLSLGALHLGWQVKRLDIDSAADCLAKFKSNRDFGLIVLGAIVAGQVG